MITYKHYLFWQKKKNPSIQSSYQALVHLSPFSQFNRIDKSKSQFKTSVYQPSFPLFTEILLPTHHPVPADPERHSRRQEEGYTCLLSELKMRISFVLEMPSYWGGGGESPSPFSHEATHKKDKQEGKYFRKHRVVCKSSSIPST